MESLLTVNVVVIRANMDRLRGIVDLLGRFRGLRLKFAMVEPKGAALERFEELVPPLDEAAARIGDALVYAREAAPELRLAHEGVPLCLISPPEELSGDLGDLTGGLKEEGFTLMSEANERDFFPVDSENRTFAPCCEGCLLRGRCPGLYRRYLERRGASSLQPRVRE